MTNYGTKIAELRTANKMTQAQLGAMLNVTSQAVSKWENGLSEPDIESIKKMCQIFGISFDEFFGAEPRSTDAEPEPPKTESSPVILAYCEVCDKAMTNPKEYRVSIVDGIQHTTCLECAAKQDKEARQRTAQERADREARRISEGKHQLFKGMLWGILGAVILAAIALTVGIIMKEPLIYILGTILCAYGGFTFVTQMIWDNSVSDVFLFFLRTLKLPGVIFTLDIDGILFLIFVKILGAIVSALFTTLCFVVGIFVSVAYSMILFPFAFIKEMRDIVRNR